MAIIKSFNHPQKGLCRVEKNMLALHWEKGISENQKKKLLSSLKLGIITSTELAKVKMKVNVNNTDTLSWVGVLAGGRLSKNVVLDDRTIQAIENSELVEWVAPVFRAPVESEYTVKDENLFTINPRRIFVEGKLNSIADLEGASEFSLEIDQAKSSVFPNMTVLEFRSTSLAKNNTVFDFLEKQYKFKSETIYHLENIPFISPVCCNCGQSKHAVNNKMKKVKPNDPMFSSQWGLQQISAPFAWSTTEGDPDIVVAVLDQGVQLDHPDLSLYPDSWNATTGLPNGSPTGNHGTACAGIVAAKSNNALGLTGVAGKCRIMAIATATWADTDIAGGLYFAADHGAHVMSMSFGVYPWWGAWDFQLIQNALQYAYDKGLVLVAASGNENIPQSRFPGSDSRTICVGGTNREDLRKAVNDSSIEKFWGACYGESLDVTAPCLEIPTTDRLGVLGYSAGDYYNRFNGTSSATPHVAGLAALLLSCNKNLDNETVREIIESTCDKVRTDKYTYTNVGFKMNGPWNNEVGYGRINAERAVALACGYGKAKGECCSCTESYLSMPEICEECVSPAPQEWVDCNNCMKWFLPAVITREISDLRKEQRYQIQIEITKELKLCLKGRHRGKLLYTTTLIPKEELRIYHYDRYRHVTSAEARMSVHTSFRQSVSALWQTRISSDFATYAKNINSIKAEYDSSSSLLGFLFGGVDVGESSKSENAISLKTSTDIFSQVAVSASSIVEAERSIVISNYEDKEKVDTTSRVLRNLNECRAVNYYIRRINEVYDLSSRILSIRWRIVNPQNTAISGWKDISEINLLPANIRQYLYDIIKDLPKVGEEEKSLGCINIPTDGTFIEAELAHCSSCDSERMMTLEIAMEKSKAEARKECLEAELLALEVERRKKLLAAGKFDEFNKQALVPLPQG